MWFVRIVLIICASEAIFESLHPQTRDLSLLIRTLPTESGVCGESPSSPAETRASKALSEFSGQWLYIEDNYVQVAYLTNDLQNISSVIHKLQYCIVGDSVGESGSENLTEACFHDMARLADDLDPTPILPALSSWAFIPAPECAVRYDNKALRPLMTKWSIPESLPVNRHIVFRWVIRMCSDCCVDEDLCQSPDAQSLLDFDWQMSDKSCKLLIQFPKQQRSYLNPSQLQESVTTLSYCSDGVRIARDTFRPPYQTISIWNKNYKVFDGAKFYEHLLRSHLSALDCMDQGASILFNICVALVSGKSTPTYDDLASYCYRSGETPDVSCLRDYAKFYNGI